LSESLAAVNELLPVILFSQHFTYRGADLTLKGKDGKTHSTWQWSQVTKKPSSF